MNCPIVIPADMRTNTKQRGNVSSIDNAVPVKRRTTLACAPVRRKRVSRRRPAGLTGYFR